MLFVKSTHPQQCFHHIASQNVCMFEVVVIRFQFISPNEVVVQCAYTNATNGPLNFLYYVCTNFCPNLVESQPILIFSYLMHVTIDFIHSRRNEIIGQELITKCQKRQTPNKCNILKCIFVSNAKRIEMRHYVCSKFAPIYLSHLPSFYTIYPSSKIYQLSLHSKPQITSKIYLRKHY